MNNIDSNLPQRKMPRLHNFDYNTIGAYFITICTENRAEILSHVVGVGVPDDPDCVELLPYGKIADKYIKQLNDFYEDISVDRYVIMPNHIHILLSLRNGSSRTPTPTTYEATFAEKSLNSNEKHISKDNTKANSSVSKFVSNLFLLSNVFAIKNAVRIYGKDFFTTTLYEIARIIRNT